MSERLLHCVARAEYVEIGNCEGEVEMRTLKSDSTTVPLCDLHVVLYDVVEDDLVVEKSSFAVRPQSSQTTQSSQ